MLTADDAISYEKANYDVNYIGVAVIALLAHDTSIFIRRLSFVHILKHDANSCQ